MSNVPKTKSVLALHFCSARQSDRQFAQGGWSRRSDRPEGLACVATHFAAQHKAFALEVSFDLLKRMEPTHHFSPFPGKLRLSHPFFEFPFQQQRQVTAEDRTADGFIPLVIDRPRFEDAFGRPKDRFHHPWMLVKWRQRFPLPSRCWSARPRSRRSARRF